jgi:hypothetical protein
LAASDDVEIGLAKGDMTISILSLAERISNWWPIGFSRNTRIDGLWVGSSSYDANALRRVAEALTIIKTYDPYRYKRVLREFDHLLAHLTPASAAVFLPHLKRCVLDERFVLSAPVERLASVIVHEATHGTLRRHRIGYSEALRPRVEHVCMRQELAFALKVPNGEETQKWIKRRIETPLLDLTDKGMRERHSRGEVEMARHAGVPNWMIRAALSFRGKFVDPHRSPR